MNILTNYQKSLVINNKLKVSNNILKANRLDYLLSKAEMETLDVDTLKNMIENNNMDYDTIMSLKLLNKGMNKTFEHQDLKNLIQKAKIADWLKTHDRVSPDYTLKDIPENVIDLDLSMQDLEELPDFITELTYLQFLRLTRNNLTQLPESIGNLKSLLQIWVDANKLTKLPESIKNLKKLKYIDMSNNPMSKVEKNKIVEYCKSNNCDVSV
jgi:Leucine-rich repeat (LRR) protein